MAYPATDISNRAAGDFVTDVMWDELVDALNFLANRPACRVYHSAAQSLANNTDTTLAFNSERYDTDSMHDTVTLNSRVTFNKAGLYTLFATLDFAANATGIRVAYIMLNATTTLALDIRNASSADVTSLTLATTYKFAAGDHVILVAKQTSGGALNVSSAGNRTPEFGATWIGRG